MGEWKEIMKAGLAWAKEKAQSTREEYNQYCEHYEHFDDQQLLRYYKGAIGIRRMAIASVLQSRGYTIRVRDNDEL